MTKIYTVEKKTKILIYVVVTAAETLEQYINSNISFDDKKIKFNLKTIRTLLNNISKRFTIEYDDKIISATVKKLREIPLGRGCVKNAVVIDDKEAELLLNIDYCEEYIRTNLPLNKEIPDYIRTELKKCCTRLSKFLNYINEELTE